MVNVPEPVRNEWARGDAYEPYVGRWSRLIARQFLNWLSVPAKATWLDVGSGTGALSEAVLKQSDPKSVMGIERSQGYVEYARRRVADPRVVFELGDAQSLPVKSAGYDAVISGLVLNFVPQAASMVAEMRRAAQPGGTVAAYVWDYAGKMQLMRHFWDAAIALDEAARDLDEGRRFPICDPVALAELFHNAGLSKVEARPLEIETYFKDFDDYWVPFLGGQGPAPHYTMSLDEEARVQLREKLRDSLPHAADGSILLVARAWAVKGCR